MNEVPVLRQLLICEKLVVERDTNNVSLINCHAIRRADEFPTRPVAFGVYGLLCNGFGTFAIRLEITRLDNDELVFQRLFPITFADRLRTMDFACRISDFICPVEGDYEFVVGADQDLLGSSMLVLKGR
jgi:hypothetical protein